MTEMREFWANVYVDDGVASQGYDHATREECENRAHDWADYRYRIHVRLKPEGAPKRYAGPCNQAAWERFPEWCRDFVADGGSSTAPWAPPL